MYLFSVAFARAHFQYDSHPWYYFRFWSINALSASKVAEFGSWELLVVPRVDRVLDLLDAEGVVDDGAREEHLGR